MSCVMLRSNRQNDTGYEVTVICEFLLAWVEYTRHTAAPQARTLNAMRETLAEALLLM